jgi:hypothetical protein
MSPAPSEKHLEDWIVNNLHQFGDSCPIDWYISEYFPDAQFINEHEFVTPFF